jgi:hypothetical protein
VFARPNHPQAITLSSFSTTAYHRIGSAALNQHKTF